jgi:hypothetical protein
MLYFETQVEMNGGRRRHSTRDEDGSNAKTGGRELADRKKKRLRSSQSFGVAWKGGKRGKGLRIEGGAGV